MDLYNNPLSIGVDIETGGHVFQLHFSNLTGMNERAFLTETTGSWDKTEIRFGFNLSRMFQLKKKKDEEKEWLIKNRVKINNPWLKYLIMGYLYRES